jgi:molybdate transport system substrate-binding protein
MIAAILGLALAAGTPGPAGTARPEVLVFAAASLSDALAEAGRVCAAAGGPRAVFNFAGSNELARQVAAGAPAQVFISADRAQVARLEAAGTVRAGESFPLLGNSLVVIVPRASEARPLADPGGLLTFARLSIADPEAVPAGVYVRRWLERAGLWKQLAPRVVPALDVRAALAAVAAGNLPAGIVYATDAASTDRVRVIYRVSADAAPEIRYYVAPLARPSAPSSPSAAASAQAAAVADFQAFLRGPVAREIFVRHGFIPLAGCCP